jgi:hypothetical protein
MTMLEKLLEEYQVHASGVWENELNNSIISEWYAVSNNDGIIAYFSNEKEACYYRLCKINRILNN